MVVDGHQCEAVEVEIRVPQGSSVSPILFAIYLIIIFKNVQDEVEECMTTSFTDEYGWLVTVDSVAQTHRHRGAQGMW